METIFDSRKAAKLYVDETHVRSSTFEVKPGEVALVELTTKHGHFDKMSFKALRVPQAIDGEECYPVENAAKIYHQVPCGNDFGESCEMVNQTPTTHTPFAASVLRWGKDHVNKKTNEYHYITRPGTYYLVARNNETLMDCNVITLIEVSKMPATHNIHLHQVCTGDSPDEDEVEVRDETDT